ncbi:hypothetical protein RJ640_013076 [Escallonia rubra]|uniref:Uncharacterized protein n=1 Tax=Escallonia rubra TaxID=112253 RepID=A0AA88UCT9_9ASTE|nr:hypothetical protein RJ640_013076 [Escallonia rubra]
MQGDELRTAFTALMYHEMTHVFQWSGNFTAPGPLTEEIADYMVLRAKLNGAGFALPGQGDRWDEGYEVTARFLEYCDSLMTGFTAALNNKMRYAYSEDYFVQLLGKPVSHHPMIVACHCEGTGWRFWGDNNLRSKFWGRSIQLDPVGVLTLEFDDGEVLQWSKVTTSIYNLILGKLYCDHYGTMRIQGNCKYSCKLKFKEQSIIDRNPHQVQGIVQGSNGKTLATLFGKWDESMHYVTGDCSRKGKGFESLSDAHLLWKRSKPPQFPTRYNLSRFAITLNELKNYICKQGHSPLILLMGPCNNTL